MPGDHDESLDDTATLEDQKAFERKRQALAAQLANLPLFANSPYGDHDDSPTTHPLIVASRFVPLRNWKQLVISAVAGAVVSGLHDDLAGAGRDALAGLVIAGYNTMQRLNDDELLVIETMQRLAAGSVYIQWQEETDILDALKSELDTGPARLALANMKSRGILEEGAGKWRAVL